MTTAIVEPKHQPEILDPIVNWEHWDTIQQVALREYGLSAEQFSEALPEYQRFLGLILAGNVGVPMHSEQVDKVWHAHILTTTLYVPFCEEVFGRYIHHVPNLFPSAQNCVSPGPCASKCLSICKTPPPKCTEEGSATAITDTDFREAYQALYGAQPPAIWNLTNADGVSL